MPIFSQYNKILCTNEKGPSINFGSVHHFIQLWELKFHYSGDTTRNMFSEVCSKKQESPVTRDRIFQSEKENSFE